LEDLENRCLPSVTVHEFLLPTTGTGVTGIIKGADGNLWFTEPTTNIVGHISPVTGSIVEIVLPNAGSMPLEIAGGSDGNLWFTEQGTSKIGRITPAGALTEFPTLTASAMPSGISLGADGNLWFTEFGVGKIGRITTSGTVTEFTLPSATRGPYGIGRGPDGNLWFTEKTANQIGRITPTGSMTEFALPSDSTSPAPWGIARGADKNLWVTLSGTNKIARVTTSGSVMEFTLSIAGGPHGIAAAPDGNLYFAETNVGEIGRISTAGSISMFQIPTLLSFPQDVTMGPDGNLWFTESNTDRIGEAVLPHYTVTGPEMGGGPDVRVIDVATGQIFREFYAYDPRYGGGVRVAMGDFNNDGIPDIVTAPGVNSGPDIRVYDGLTGDLVRAIGAFSPFFSGGEFVAAGDIAGDGYADIIVGADAGGGPEVKVFDGKDGSLLMDFMAYSPKFSGGVRVAAGNVSGSGHADIITAAGPGGGPHVEVFSGTNGALLRSFYAFGASFSGGVYVAAGDTAGDGFADIIAGTGAETGQQANVRVFDGADGSLLQNFVPYGSGYFGGVRVASFDVDGDGHADIITAPGGGMVPLVQVFDGISLAKLDSFFAYDQLFQSGVYVGGQ
jgi:streptogramin lyase